MRMGEVSNCLKNVVYTPVKKVDNDKDKNKVRNRSKRQQSDIGNRQRRRGGSKNYN